MTDAYCELHCHSSYSLLDGVSAPAALAARAADLGMPALALTDHNAVYGAVEFVQACREVDIRPILGAELTLYDGSHLTLLVRNQTGWENLCALITLAQHNAPKGEARLPRGVLGRHADGLTALTGCRHGALSRALVGDDAATARAVLTYLQEGFGREHVWVELQRHRLPDDRRRTHQLVEAARGAGAGIVATNNVHYADRDQQRLQDVVVCINQLTTLDEADGLLRPNAEYYLKSAAEMGVAFRGYPSAIANTLRIAEQCQFDLHFGLQTLPDFPTPAGVPAIRYLHDLCEQAVPQRVVAPSPRVYEQLYHELAVIERAGLANYFLIVWDIVHYAQTHGIRCQGRGSAANSLVAYLLTISPIDPLQHDLVFERFLSDERQAVPDIDVDFDAARREEVIQYVYRRYGAAHAAMACTFSTFRTRGAVRDVVKVLGLSAEHAAHALDQLEERAEDGRMKDEGESLPDQLTPQSADKPTNHLLSLVRQLKGLPRHLGIHNGGLVLMGAPLAARLPTEPAAMADRTVVQWDKESLEAAGIVKIDILGLRMLSAIDEANQLIGRAQPPEPARSSSSTNAQIASFADPTVYTMISAADTMGVFQVESRAQAQVLPQLKPATFNDLIVTISLIRPGPVQGNMVHPYLRRRAGVEPVTYLHPLLEPALRETLGVILFQEQVLKVARDVAGFTAGQGEQLRRALGSKHGPAAVDRFHDLFVAGAERNGVSADSAEQIFTQLRAFGGYSFAKSHAAAFAVLVYESAWLRHYHPAPFFCALLNNQPMGFWTPAVLVGDARRCGLEVRPVDIRRSHGRCTLEEGHIRLGFNYVKGFGEAAIELLLTARGERRFSNLADLCRRTRLPRRLVEHLIIAGALDKWGSRRDLLWRLGLLQIAEDELPLLFDDTGATLAPLTEAEQQAMELSMTGLSTGDHVLTHLRPSLPTAVLGSRALEQVPSGKRIQIGGLLVVHQAPYTAKGFRFLTLEDEDGLMNVVIRPKLYPTYRHILRTTSLLRVEGIVERQGPVVNVRATHLAPLVA